MILAIGRANSLERISKEKTCIRRQVGEAQAIRESRNKVKKGEVFENFNAKNEYTRSSIPDPEDEPPTESDIKAEEKIKKEILRLKRLSKAKLHEIDEDVDGERSQAVPQPQPRPQEHLQPQPEPQPHSQPHPQPRPRPTLITKYS